MSLFLHCASILLVLSMFMTTSCSSQTHKQHITFPSTRTIQPPGKVLFVLSAASEQTLANGKTRKTGYFLNEFYEPHKTLTDSGYSVVIATPQGRAPALDPESLKARYWKDTKRFEEAKKLIRTSSAMKQPITLREARENLRDYQAVIVPGGQGVMVDLLDDPTLHDILREAGQKSLPVGLICHAPSILTRMERAKNPFVGRRVTSVSGVEEWYIETFVMGAEAKNREIGDTLKKSGFSYSASFPGRSGAVRDCNLVTSQNPFSGHAFTELMQQALMDWRRGGRCGIQNQKG